MKRIHKVCSYLKRIDVRSGKSDSVKCSECPAWEYQQILGKKEKVQRLCYGLAKEMTNVVKTGNPWGKKNCKWP